MAPDEIAKIIHFTEASQIWSHFESAYGKKTSNLKMELMGELNSLMCQNSDDVTAAVNKALTIRGKLTNLGVVVDSCMIMSALMKSLPSCYDNFIETWAMFDTDRDDTVRDERSMRLQIVELESTLWQKFEEARSRFQCITDFELSSWAREIYHKKGMKEFKACKSFITAFKNEYKITSRAITKIVTKRNILSLQEKQVRAKKFAEEQNRFLKEHKINHAYPCLAVAM